MRSNGVSPSPTLRGRAENFSRSAKIRWPTRRRGEVRRGEKMARLNSFPIRIYVPCTRREWLIALYDRSPACLVYSSGPLRSSSIRRHPRQFFPPDGGSKPSVAGRDIFQRETEIEIKASDRVNPSECRSRPLTLRFLLHPCRFSLISCIKTVIIQIARGYCFLSPCGNRWIE